MQINKILSLSKALIAIVYLLTTACGEPENAKEKKIPPAKK